MKVCKKGLHSYIANPHKPGCPECRKIARAICYARYLENNDRAEYKANYNKLHSPIWYKKNYKRLNEVHKNKYETDLNFRLKAQLRSRLAMAVKNNQKVGSAIKDLGCSLEDFKIHLESKFQEGMTWDNRELWHIDHIKPLSKFNLTDRSELLKACHYTNLQPLWAADNISKGAK